MRVWRDCGRRPRCGETVSRSPEAGSAPRAGAMGALEARTGGEGQGAWSQRKGDVESARIVSL